MIMIFIHMVSATTPMVLSDAAVEDLENRIDKSAGSIDFHI
jgi:hypothetical protein